MSEAAKRRCTPEWRKAMSEKLSVKLPIDEVRRLYESGMTQEEVGKYFGVTQRVIWGFMRRNGIQARVAFKRNQLGSNNSNWKSDRAGYQACHLRVIASRGRPLRCEECGTTDPARSYDWANLTGKFHDVDDYKRLCRSCHWKLDDTVLNFQKGNGAREE